MTVEEMKRAAQHLAAARLGGPMTPLPPPELTPSTLEEGYRIQQYLNEIFIAEGFGEIVGHKIGCTTPVMQEYLNISQPSAGAVYANNVHQERATVSLSAHHNLGVEVEIAARLGQDLPGGAGPYDRDSVAFAVKSLAGAIELVDERYQNRSEFNVATLIADDFFNVGVILGAPQENWRELDLVNLAGRMRAGDQVVGQGRGGDILGHPLNALAWFANHRVSLGRPLKAGEFVMLGSVVKTTHFTEPITVRGELDGLSTAEVTFIA